MSKIRECMNDIKVQLAKKNEADTNHKQTTQRLILKTDENQTKIVDLEVQIAAINTKLMIFGVLATIIVPIITGFLIRLFFHSGG